MQKQREVLQSCEKSTGTWRLILIRKYNILIYETFMSLGFIIGLKAQTKMINVSKETKAINKKIDQAMETKPALLLRG